MRAKPMTLPLLIILVLAAFGPSTDLAQAKDRNSGPPSKASATEPAKAAAAPAGAHHDASTRLVGWLELTGPLRESPPALAIMGEDQGKPTLRRVLTKIRMVARDPDYVGLVIHLDEPELETAQVEEISRAIHEVRAKGKKVLVFAESYDRHGYLLACAADRIVLQHKGELELEGLGVEEMYLAGLLEKVGAKADFLQVGKYKGAEEPLTRKGPSPEWSQNFDSLLDDIYSQNLETIGQARKLDRAQVEKALADCWTMSDEQYVQRHLIDDLANRDLVDVTQKQFGDDFDWDDLLAPAESGVSVENPLALLQLLFQESKAGPTRQSIALIHASGEIVSGDGEDGDGLFGSESIGSRKLVDSLGDAQDDKLIKGVVLRIDSPGGSALASEIIWQAVRETAKVKPVYISVGPMAASGGYYIACAGDRIYVSDASIVGSIGVVGGKITLGGLYDKIGVSVFRRSRGPLGDMFNSVEPFTPEQRTALESAFKRTYDQFVDRVGIGRGKKIKVIADVAQGRIFTGRQAVANGLADKVGGVEMALDDMAKDLKLRPGTYDVVNFPAPMSLPQYLNHLVDGMAMAPGAGGAGGDNGNSAEAMIRLARFTLGPRAWRQAGPVLSGIMLLRREPVLTLFPAALVIR